MANAVLAVMDCDRHKVTDHHNLFIPAWIDSGQQAEKANSYRYVTLFQNYLKSSLSLPKSQFRPPLLVEIIPDSAFSTDTDLY
jgi:hypothetical protein